MDSYMDLQVRQTVVASRVLRTFKSGANSTPPEVLALTSIPLFQDGQGILHFYCGNGAAALVLVVRSSLPQLNLQSAIVHSIRASSVDPTDSKAHEQEEPGHFKPPEICHAEPSMLAMNLVLADPQRRSERLLRVSLTLQVGGSLVEAVSAYIRVCTKPICLLFTGVPRHWTADDIAEHWPSLKALTSGVDRHPVAITLVSRELPATVPATGSRKPQVMLAVALRSQEPPSDANTFLLEFFSSARCTHFVQEWLETSVRSAWPDMCIRQVPRRAPVLVALPYIQSSVRMAGASTGFAPLTGPAASAATAPHDVPDVSPMAAAAAHAAALATASRRQHHQQLAADAQSMTIPLPATAPAPAGDDSALLERHRLMHARAAPPPPLRAPAAAGGAAASAMVPGQISPMMHNPSPTQMMNPMHLYAAPPMTIPIGNMGMSIPSMPGPMPLGHSVPGFPYAQYRTDPMHAHSHTTPAPPPHPSMYYPHYVTHHQKRAWEPVPEFPAAGSGIGAGGYPYPQLHQSALVQASASTPASMLAASLPAQEADDQQDGADVAAAIAAQAAKRARYSASL